VGHGFVIETALQRIEEARRQGIIATTPSAVNKRSLTTIFRRHGLLRKWQSFQKRMAQ
jgi:hypothetical protein